MFQIKRDPYELVNPWIEIPNAATGMDGENTIGTLPT